MPKIDFSQRDGLRESLRLELLRLAEYDLSANGNARELWNARIEELRRESATRGIEWLDLYRENPVFTLLKDSRLAPPPLPLRTARSQRPAFPIPRCRLPGPPRPCRLARAHTSANHHAAASHASAMRSNAAASQIASRVSVSSPAANRSLRPEDATRTAAPSQAAKSALPPPPARRSSP